MSVDVPSMSEEHERRLWLSMRDKGDGAARKELAENYMPLARTIAAQLYGMRADNDVEFEDYRQFAFAGLMEAMDRYDLSSDAKFSTFAGYRIRGAILNGVQKFSERKEQAAFRARVQRERVASLCNESTVSGRQVLFEEMVDLTVGLALGYMLEDTGIFRSGDAVVEDSTYKTHHMNELRNRLRHIVEVLPEREQLLIRYHYYHHVDFDQIAEMMEISKGRVSQLHKKALKLIKEAMLGFRELDGYY